MLRRSLIALGIALALVGTACDSDDTDGSATPVATETATVKARGPIHVDAVLAAVRDAGYEPGETDRPNVEAEGGAWCVEVGSPGTAVAGSGDVKAGAVAGLLARGATPSQAGAWGAYLHGRAGERLTASVGRVGFLAREVARELPRALAEIEA